MRHFGTYSVGDEERELIHAKIKRASDAANRRANYASGQISRLFDFVFAHRRQIEALQEEVAELKCVLIKVCAERDEERSSNQLTP